MKQVILTTALFALTLIAQAVTPTPTPTPILFGKIPEGTDVSSDAGWTIVGEKLITPVSGGGIEGTIADGQVAYGAGMAIAGSDNLKWDDANSILSIAGPITLGPDGEGS